MASLIFQGATIETDADGFIQDFNDWNENIAEYIADLDKIAPLLPDHWTVIRFLRQYYSDHEFTPPLRMLCKETQISLNQLHELFTDRPMREACKVAGLPKPTGCV